MPSDTKSLIKKNPKHSFEVEKGKSETPKSGFLKFCQDNHDMCMWLCFLGIIVCYTYYALLQEIM